MSPEPKSELDLAVVGGGVSGLYAAWRLAQESRVIDPKRIAVFELSRRLGGRLWSVGTEKEKSIPAELGGMYFSDAQSLVYGLCSQKLGLPLQSITPKPDFAYTRRRRFKIDDLPKPEVAPYNLLPDEQGKTYHELMFMALQAIVPNLDKLWPLNPGATIADTVQYLRSSEFDGRPLEKWGFWNLLARVQSNEAYLCIRDLVSSYSVFGNVNGYDATLSMLCDLTGHWFNLPEGYETLPSRLAQELAAMGSQVHENARVLKLGIREDGTLDLQIGSDALERKIHARSVILALPKKAIKDIVGQSGSELETALEEPLSAVEGIPACKLFLTFEEPWWRTVPEGPGRIDQGTFAASHTDLPMRQCYYLGSDPETGEGLMLASYSDSQSVPFWATLMTETGRDPGLTGKIPAHGLREIRRQLSVMHGVDVPAPADGLFVNWHSAPYGGGWHLWQPGFHSANIAARLRRPLPAHRLHICGEAYSSYQGWVEGALTSAEVLLEEQFGLELPDWLESKQCLSPYFFE